MDLLLLAWARYRCHLWHHRGLISRNMRLLEIARDLKEKWKMDFPQSCGVHQQTTRTHCTVRNYKLRVMWILHHKDLKSSFCSRKWSSLVYFHSTPRGPTHPASQINHRERQLLDMLARSWRLFLWLVAFRGSSVTPFGPSGLIWWQPPWLVHAWTLPAPHKPLWCDGVGWKIEDDTAARGSSQVGVTAEPTWEYWIRICV